MSKPLRKRWSFRLFLFICLGVLIIHLNYRWVDWTYKGRIYDSTEVIPHNNFGVVLGTSPRLSNGHANAFFIARMDAAADLYHAEKIDKIITSGSNDGAYYDEADIMANALNKRGVPFEDIIEDNSGHRTLDSIIRANETFGLDKFTVISQPFHNHRAIYIARHQGIDAIAYNAARVGGWQNVRAQTREHGARALMMADLYLLDTKPLTLAR